MATFINDSNLAVVRDSLQYISKSSKAKLNDLKSNASKIHNIILQDGNPLERFYFIHLLCQLTCDEKPNKVERMLKLVLPSPPSAQSMALVSDIISFALCHPSSHMVILDQLSSQLSTCDMVKIDIESWHQAASLALDSPGFCSALLSRPDLHQMDIDKKLLAKWLQDLSRTDHKFPVVNISHIIRQLLLASANRSNNTQEDSDLHFSILSLIQSRRCMTITNQFLIEMANQLAKLVKELNTEDDTESVTMLLDRFGQILSVAAACKVTTITNTLRQALTCLDSNRLIAGLIKWQNE